MFDINLFDVSLFFYMEMDFREKENLYTCLM